MIWILGVTIFLLAMFGGAILRVAKDADERIAQMDLREDDSARGATTLTDSELCGPHPSRTSDAASDGGHG